MRLDVTLGMGLGHLPVDDQAAQERRGRVTDEYICAFRELWTSDNPTFKGKFVNFSNLIFLPKPTQKTIPIWIGGHSKAALKRAGQLGDGWHPIGGVPTIPLEPEDVKKDWALMADYAEKAGRDPKTIRVALKGSLFDKDKKIANRRRRFMGSAEEIAADIRAYAAAGVDTMIFDVRQASSAETLERMEWMAKDVYPKV